MDTMETSGTARTAPPREAVLRLLDPATVAIVGASATPGALGASVLGNLLRSGFTGDIHLVNPKRDEIGGRRCVPSVDALPDGVDCAVLAIPRDAVLDTLRACGRKRMGGVIIFSAGFAEDGEEGAAAQAEIARIARDYGMAVEGPNCLGLVNYRRRAPLTFVETEAVPPGAAGGIAIVSQSGAMAAVLTTALRSHDIDLTYSVSTGNEAASGVEDYLEHVLADGETRVVAMIVEQFRDPQRFLLLAEAARAGGREIVLLHPGRSQAARLSAATHTGALAGDYDVMRTVVRHAGVTVVDSIEELLDTTELLFRMGRLARSELMIMTESGAFKAICLDQCEQLGLPLAELQPGTVVALRAELPAFIPVSNPLDTTAQALVDPGLYRRTLAAVAPDDGVGVVLLGIIMTDRATSGRKLPPLLEAGALPELRGRMIVSGLDEGGRIDPEQVAALRALGIPFLPTTERVLRALRHCGPRTARLRQEAPDTRDATVSPPSGLLAEWEGKQLLGGLGVATPDGGLANDLNGAQAIAARIGYPVVLKAQARALPHKSEAGGVVLSLGDPEALAEGWHRLQASVSAHRPDLELDGVLVEHMSERGLELIVGGRRDPNWGPILLVGIGGVAAEALRDTRLLPPGLTEQAIVDEIRCLKAAALFDGFRGGPEYDLNAVAKVIIAIDRLMISEPALQEIEINPLVVYARGAVALDALARWLTRYVT